MVLVRVRVGFWLEYGLGCRLGMPQYSVVGI